MRGAGWLTLILFGACGGPEGPVSISAVNYYGPPAAGVRVVSNDAAGEFLEERATNASGRVELDVPDGGSVSVIANRSVMTIFAVEPGDELSFRIAPDTFTYPGQLFELPPLPSEATVHEVNAWCEWGGRDPGPRTMVTFDGSCPMPRPVVDTARSADGRAIAHVVMLDQLLTNELVIPDAWVPPARTIDVNLTGIDFADDAVGVDRWAMVDGYRAHDEYSILRGSAPSRTATMAVPALGESAYFRTTESESVTGTCFDHSKLIELDTAVNNERVILDFASAPVPPTAVRVSDDGNAVVWDGGSGGTTVHVVAGGRVSWYARVPGGHNVALLPRGLFADQDGALSSQSNALRVTRVDSNRWSSYAESRSIRMVPPSLPEYASPLERGEERRSAATWQNTSTCP